MPQLRAPDGSIVSVSDEEAGQLEAGGYQPVTLGQAGAVIAERERPTSGALAPIGAAASSFLSGATLGASDIAFKHLFDREGYERLAADREAHPYVSGAGQLAGALFGGRTPAGYLSKAGAGLAERAGGGVAAKLGASAFEGSVYGAGSYLADSALGDREVSAEGLVGAMGSGMEFGVAGGAAALGIEQGTIAARRMFSRAAGTDKAVQAAEQEWAAKYQTTIEAHDAAADIARAKLAEYSLAKQQAQLAQQRAAADLAEARVPQPGAPIEAPAAPASAVEGAPSAPAAAPGAPTAPVSVPSEPPAVETARLLRDRAMQISETEVRAWDAAHGARLQELQIAAGIPPELAALTARAPETAASRGAILDEAAAKELAEALVDHDAARVSLDDVLQRIEAPGVQAAGARSPLQAPAVPLGEFSDVGARGFKSQDELARLAAGTGRDEVAAAVPADVTGAGGPRALRAQGTPVGAPVEPATAVGKRGAAAEPPIEIPTYEHLKAQPDAIVTTVPASVIKERGWYEMPGQGADVVKAERGRSAMREGQRDPIKITVGEDGKLFVEDGRNRLQAAVDQDKPIKVRWDYGTVRGEAAGDVLKGGAAAAPASESLTGMLRGTASKLDAGESLVEMGAPARASYLADKQARTAAAAEHFRGKALERRPFEGPTRPPVNLPEGARVANRYRVVRGEHPLAVKQLEVEHAAALDRAESAATAGERAAAEREAQAIEQHLTAVGARPGAVEDIAAIAEHVTKYEKASARLTEALGADAPPAAQEAAKALREAEKEVERKHVARTTRAIEDHAANTQPTPRGSAGDSNPLPTADDPRWFGPSTRQQQVNVLKAAKLKADARVARARAAETEAKIGARAAERQAAATRKLAEDARPKAPEPAPPSKLGAVLDTIGVAAEIGIPGLPHPKDIPLIGPLLDVYLKYRALKAASGRFVGRVAATGDARAAALVAKTKDRIAVAVDRTLGLAEQLAPKARAPLVATAVVLGRRVFDDGQPDARKGASEPEMAAVRIREISTAATRPDLVQVMVRQKLGGITDPDLIDAAVATLQKQFQYLASTMPKAPAPNPYTKTQWVPSAGDTANLARRLAVLHDPRTAIDHPTPAGADAFNNFYPKLAAYAQQRLAERAADMKNPVEYHQLVRASVVFQIPMHASLQPENAAVLRASFSGSLSGPSAGPPSGPGGPPGGPPAVPPAPSIAGPTNLSNLYQPAGARAQR